MNYTINPLLVAFFLLEFFIFRLLLSEYLKQESKAIFQGQPSNLQAVCILQGAKLALEDAHLKSLKTGLLLCGTMDGHYALGHHYPLKHYITLQSITRRRFTLRKFFATPRHEIHEDTYEILYDRWYYSAKIYRVSFTKGVRNFKRRNIDQNITPKPMSCFVFQIQALVLYVQQQYGKKPVQFYLL